jgi:hypothetical protein
MVGTVTLAPWSIDHCAEVASKVGSPTRIPGADAVT